MGNESKENVLGYSERLVVVEDSFGENQNVRFANNNYQVGETATFYLMKIRKGRMFLIPSINHKPLFNFSDYFTFRITKEFNNHRFGKSFLLEDNFGNFHPLSANHYSNYNLGIGDSIQCKIDGLSSKGYFYLEPKHPQYLIGNTYAFEVFNSLNSNGCTYCFVLDSFSEMIKVKLPNKLKVPEPESLIQCKVIDLHKGLPVLEYIQG